MSVYARARRLQLTSRELRSIGGHLACTVSSKALRDICWQYSCPIHSESIVADHQIVNTIGVHVDVSSQFRVQRASACY